MSFIVTNIHLILIVSGLATCSMLLQALAPRWAVRFLFGEEIVSASALLIARSWAAMIFASGLMLIYASYHPEVRLPILLYSIAGKLGFTGLVFANGRRYLAKPAFAAAIGDLIIVILLICYLLKAS